MGSPVQYCQSQIRGDIDLLMLVQVLDGSSNPVPSKDDVVKWIRPITFHVTFQKRTGKFQHARGEWSPEEIYFAAVDSDIPSAGSQEEREISGRAHSVFIRSLIVEICAIHCRRSACSRFMMSVCGQWK